MQEINLLQNRIKDSTLVWHRRNKAIIAVLTVVLVLEMVLSGVFYIMSRSTEKKIEQVNTDNTALQSEINAADGKLMPAKAFQAQLVNLKYILDKHIYWSEFFEKLSGDTYIKVKYLSMQSDIDGKVHLEGSGESYLAIAKLMLSLEQSEYFSEVKLMGLDVSEGDTSGYSFTMDMDAKKDIFKKD